MNDSGTNKQEGSIGRWVSIVYRYGQSYLAKKLEAYNIGRGQYGILTTLFRNGGINQEELADRLKTDKGSIAKSVKKLEEEGYIERSTDMEDKRAYRVNLTPKGQDVIPVLLESIDRWESEITAAFSEDERRQVEKLLHKMADEVCSIRDNETGSGK